MTRFRNQSEETEDYGITTQFTPDRFAVRELLALATVGVRQGSEAGPDRGPNRTFRPEAGQTGDIPQVSEQANGNAARKLITVSSDIAQIDPGHQGGDIVSAELLAHKLEEGKEQPFTLLTSQPEHLYIAQSGLVGRNGPDSQPRVVHL